MVLLRGKDHSGELLGNRVIEDLFKLGDVDSDLLLRDVGGFEL